MRTIGAIRMTAEAARRLREARLGRVHSVFARALNVELEGLGDAGWISLHELGAGAVIPAPFGVACSALQTRPEWAGAPVRLTDGGLDLVGGPRVRLTAAAVVDTALPDAGPTPVIPDCLEWAEPGRRAGVLPVAAAILRGERGRPASESVLVRLAGPRLRRLAAATARGDAMECAAAAASLLGLGPGLTPAGDDALVGWLAGAWTAGPRAQALARVVGPATLAVAPARTGALSVAFLAAAVTGIVAEPVLRFVTRPDAAALADLVALGGTSGADVLAGYLLARRAFCA